MTYDEFNEILNSPNFVEGETSKGCYYLCARHMDLVFVILMSEDHGAMDSPADILSFEAGDPELESYAAGASAL
jgi:hypothetical protein